MSPRGIRQRCGSVSPMMQHCIQNEGHEDIHTNITGATWPNHSKAILSLAEPLWRIIADHVPTDSEQSPGEIICYRDAETWPCGTARAATCGSKEQTPTGLTFDRRYKALRRRLRATVNDPGERWPDQWGDDDGVVTMASGGLKASAGGYGRV